VVRSTSKTMKKQHAREAVNQAVPESNVDLSGSFTVVYRTKSGNLRKLWTNYSGETAEEVANEARGAGYDVAEVHPTTQLEASRVRYVRSLEMGSDY
jgi:hypothetical protein